MQKLREEVSLNCELASIAKEQVDRLLKHSKKAWEKVYSLPDETGQIDANRAIEKAQGFDQEIYKQRWVGVACTQANKALRTAIKKAPPDNGRGRNF